MRLHKVAIVSIGVLMLSAVAASQGRSAAEARLRAAMDKETVDGDLKAAIDGYKQVISQRGASREVVAQALLRLGMAYDKQGDTEARQSYERLVREFGDQPTVVQQAQARLAGVTPSGKGPSFRQVCTGDICGPGALSPDGRLLLAYVADRVNGDALVVRDLETAQSRRLASVNAPVGFCCGVFSHDGRRIAFTLTNSGSGDSEVVVVNADGSERRVVYRDGTPQGWSPDGRRLLVSPSAERKLLWVTLANDTTEPVRMSDGWKNLAQVRVSPDGRYIAFSANRTSGEQDNVYLMAAAGAGETRVSASPSYQSPVGWSPDGRYLLYWQVGPDLRGSAVVRGRSLWAVPVATGRVLGPPVKVRQFDDQAVVLGVSSTGTLYYRQLSSTADAYTASMDPASGKVTSVPAVLPTSSPALPAAWSSDGRRVAYLTGAAQERELHVFSLQDGTDQRVPSKIPFVNSLCWPPGSEAVLTNTITAPGGAGPNGVMATRFETVRVDLATGEHRFVFPGALTFRLWNCTETTAANSDPIAVKVRNVATGAETQLYRFTRPTANYGMSKISPDGRLVAFLESLDPETSVLLTVPSTGGPARELARAKAPAKLQEIDGHSWSHDSRFVYFLKRANSNAPYELYRVPAAGGTEERMGLQGQELRALAIAPDGRTAFFALGGFNRPEIWAMENFLPSGN